jgi:5'-nucleotidase/UDP-sugar diphosphatase
VSPIRPHSRSRVTSITASATGQPVDPGANYRVVTNDFMINGGDNYTTFQQGTNPVIYSDQLLSDVLADYVPQFSPVNQHIEGRISPQ